MHLVQLCVSTFGPANIVQELMSVLGPLPLAELPLGVHLRAVALERDVVVRRGGVDGPEGHDARDSRFGRTRAPEDAVEDALGAGWERGNLRLDDAPGDGSS